MVPEGLGWGSGNTLCTSEALTGPILLCVYICHIPIVGVTIVQRGIPFVLTTGD